MYYTSKTFRGSLFTCRQISKHDQHTCCSQVAGTAKPTRTSAKCALADQVGFQRLFAPGRMDRVEISYVAVIAGLVSFASIGS